LKEYIVTSLEKDGKGAHSFPRGCNAPGAKIITGRGFVGGKSGLGGSNLVSCKLKNRLPIPSTVELVGGKCQDTSCGFNEFHERTG